MDFSKKDNCLNTSIVRANLNDLNQDKLLFNEFYTHKECMIISSVTKSKYGAAQAGGRLIFSPKKNSLYLTTGDYLDINSSVTFSLSSTGMGAPAPNEIVIKFPNGGESIDKDTEVSIKWKTYGSIPKVDLAYFSGSDPDMEKDDGWIDISAEIANVDSFSWTPSSTTGLTSAKDSLRIRVKSSDGKIRDMSGWYFSVTEKSSSFVSGDNSNATILKKLFEE